MRIASELCAALGKTPVEAADYPGLHRQPHPDADDQRGDLRGDGRRRHAGGDRRGDEARDESPDGTADARRLHRPRRLPRDPQRPARRARRSEVPAVSRYCGGWSPPGSSGASPARAFTRTSHSAATTGPRIAISCSDGAHVGQHRTVREDPQPRRLPEDVQVRDVPLAVERPEQLNAARRVVVGRRASRAADASRTPPRTSARCARRDAGRWRPPPRRPGRRRRPRRCCASPCDARRTRDRGRAPRRGPRRAASGRRRPVGTRDAEAAPSARRGRRERDRRVHATATPASAWPIGLGIRAGYHRRFCDLRATEAKVAVYRKLLTYSQFLAHDSRYCA